MRQPEAAVATTLLQQADAQSPQKAFLGEDGVVIQGQLTGAAAASLGKNFV